MWAFFQLVCGCILYKQLASLQHNRMTALQCPDHSEGCRQLSEAAPGLRAAMTSASAFLAVPSRCPNMYFRCGQISKAQCMLRKEC